MRFLLIAALAALLTSCTSAGRSPEAKAGLDSAQPCCAEYAGMKFASMPVGKPVIMMLDDHRPAFVFDEGKSYFVAFAVPKSKRALRLIVISDVNGIYGGAYGSSFNKASVLRPMVMLLDAQKRPLRGLGAPDLWTQRGEQAKKIVATVLEPEARFVVYGDTSLVGKTEHLIVEKWIADPTSFKTVKKKVVETIPFDIPFAATGSVTMKLELVDAG